MRISYEILYESQQYKHCALPAKECRGVLFAYAPPGRTAERPADAYGVLFVSGRLDQVHVVVAAEHDPVLKEALDEIYAAGRYVFMDEPEIEELFYADSLQERARRTSNAPTTPQVVAAQ